jgi:hypothetical protein
MRSFWIRVVPKSNDWCLYEEERPSQGRSHVATGTGEVRQEMLRTALPAAGKRVGAFRYHVCRQLDLGLHVFSTGENTALPFFAALIAIVYHSGFWKLISSQGLGCCDGKA